MNYSAFTAKQMKPQEIAALRRDLGLSQVQFAQLFGVHFMTVSKWEHGIIVPSPYQFALMVKFSETAKVKQEEAQEKVKNLLVGAGVVAALVFLLSST
jgi:transcriptional regulator with XRE-family HTH domain